MAAPGEGQEFLRDNPDKNSEQQNQTQPKSDSKTKDGASADSKKTLQMRILAASLFVLVLSIQAGRF